MNKHQSGFVQEASWVVEGHRIAGLTFGPQDGLRVLALHGWLDNASSFELLAKAMPGVRLVAIDMPGHGLSDHRSHDAGYQIWDDLAQLEGLMDQLGWERCVLLGHSRGGMIATLFAASLPERVAALITLDGMMPYAAQDDGVIRQLRSYLKDRKRLSANPARIFDSEEDFIERRSRSGEPRHIAAKLAGRNLRQTEKGFEWRADPRLSGASAVKLNAAQCAAVLAALEMPVLNIWASPSERLERLTNAAREAAAKHVSDLTIADIEGHHHWHMEEGPAGQIANAISDFLAQKVK